MTAKKDLKRRIRERQAKTHESYTTARRHVLAAAPDTDGPPAPDAQAISADTRFGAEAAGAQAGRAIVVEELVSLTAAAGPLGFQCRIATTSALAAHVEGNALLVRFRDILLGTTDDPSMEVMRGVALRGAPRPAVPRRKDVLEKARRFIQRARVGIGGVTDDGLMMAFPIDTPSGSVMIIANVGWRPKPLPAHAKPRVVFSMLSPHDVDGFSASLLYLR
jgi:hypothetical protein